MSRDHKIVWGLVAIALLIRLIALFTFGFIDSGGGSDTVTYISLARNLFTGAGYTEFGQPHTVHHPFFPILIGITWKLTGDLLFAAQLISTLAGAFLVIPAYYLGKYLFNSRTGYYSGLLVAIFPVLVYGSSEPFCESLYTFLLVSGLAFFWAAFRKKKTTGMFLCGLLIGLAFLTHPLGVSFMPLLVVFLFLVQFSSEKTRWRSFLLRAAVLGIGFSLICLPFWLYLHGVTGSWQLSGSSHYKDLTLRLDQVEGMPEGKVIFEHMEALFNPPDTALTRKEMGMSELALRHPDRLMRIVRFNLEDGSRELRKTARFLGSPPWLLVLVLGLGMMFLAAIVIVSLARRRNRLAIGFLALMFFPMIMFVILIIEHRYFYPFFPLGLIFLAWLIAGWREKSASSSLPARLVFYLVAWLGILVMLCGSAEIIYRKWRKAEIPYEYKILGDWMRENIPEIEQEKVMMFRLGISYYAGCAWNVFYWGEYPGLIDYLKERGIRYLVVDSYKLHMIHPSLRFLLTADPLPPELSLVKEIEFEGRRIRLLEYHPKAGEPQPGSFTVFGESEQEFPGQIFLL